MTTTTQKPSRRKRWSYSVGEYGRTVSVFVERNGRLYWKSSGVRRALGFTGTLDVGALDTPDNRARAKAWARDEEKKLRDGEGSAADPAPTVAKVFAAYRAARAQLELSNTSRYMDERCGGRLPDSKVAGDKGDPGLFARVLGGDRDLSKLTLGEWQHFIRQRQAGAIDAWGREVAPDTRRPVRARTVEADCEWLAIVCNWATEWEHRDTNEPLLRAHPLKRKRFREAVPHEQNPRRPVATQDRYERLLAQAAKVHPFTPQQLVLANGTGRRISAVLGLRYEDLRLAKTKTTPFGAIQWPGVTDKEGKEWAAPLHPDVRRVIDEILAERPGIGRAYLFPSPNDPTKPMDRWYASKLLRKAERLAELPKQKGSLWHAYRRLWATARKHLPIQDVAKAGGWKNHEVLETLYEQADDATIWEVVSQPKVLREVQE